MHAAAHFFRYGFGGADYTLHDITNRQRVANLHHMLTDGAGMAAYLQRVVEPMLDALGPHPALFGFLLLNEGYSMVGKDDKTCIRSPRGTREPRLTSIIIARRSRMRG